MSKNRLRQENEELRQALLQMSKSKYTEGFRWEDYGRECCNILGIPEDPRELMTHISKEESKKRWNTIPYATQGGYSVGSAIPQNSVDLDAPALPLNYEQVLNAMRDVTYTATASMAMPSQTWTISEPRAWGSLEAAR